MTLSKPDPGAASEVWEGAVLSRLAALIDHNPKATDLKTDVVWFAIDAPVAGAFEIEPRGIIAVVESTLVVWNSCDLGVVAEGVEFPRQKRVVVVVAVVVVADVVPAFVRFGLDIAVTDLFEHVNLE